ncbi:hypothetical protein ABZ920_13150 [Streptomyces sp. NPDC046831]|uniref:hypothetical protein n=1 Tax=Streptomyces sp. NPDC046831 TaxID=3154805 RepID=UPI0033C1DC15
MGARTVRAAVTVCAAASLAAAMGTATAAPAAAPPDRDSVAQQQSRRPVLVDCFWHPRQRPGDFILACGDGNSRLHSLIWSHWGPGSATARGVNVVNDCTPYCAVGTFHSYPVVVRLDSPQPWKKHPSLHHFTRISLVYPEGRPDGFERVITYPLWN